MALALGAVFTCSPACGAGRVHGHGRYEKIKGKPQAGYVELYETNLFMSPESASPTGPSRRLGTSCTQGSGCTLQTITHDGCYCIDGLQPGTWSLVMDQPLFYVTPCVISGIIVQDGATTIVNPELSIDYSTFFKNDWVARSPGDHPPDSPWYQTFVATGTSIRGVAFSAAGDPPQTAYVGILRDNGNANPALWQLVGERAVGGVHDVTDNWVRWRSGEIPTIRGARYAVRLGGGSMQPYKRNKDALSYEHGQAYDSAGVAQPFDLNITVFTDGDGTRVTMNKRTRDLGVLEDGNFGQRWGQTFTTRGNALAAVEVWAAGAASQWNLDFTWGVRAGGPTGSLISPVKATKAAAHIAGAGFHAVSYGPGSVQYVPGETCFVEFTISNPPPGSNGFNPYVMDNDTYDDGHAWSWNGSTWQARAGTDLNMTILEYEVVGPFIRTAPDAFSPRVFLGDVAEAETLTIQNAGYGSMDYTIQTDADFVSASPASGSSTGELRTAVLTYATQGLPKGLHVAHVTITAPGATNSPRVLPVSVTVYSVAPDFDGDADVDMQDFARFQLCLSGPGVHVAGACADADFDSDLDIDQDDFTRFHKCLTGAGIHAARDCLP